MDVPRSVRGLSNGRAGWRGGLAALWRAVLPQRCALCVSPAEAPLCASCVAALPPSAPGCPWCAAPGASGLPCGRCQQRGPAFDATTALFAYAFPVDRLVQRLKYGHDLAIAEAFAQQVLARVAAPAADLLLPVPLHPARLRERGFNQAVQIARPLARAWRLPLELAAVRRVRATESQAGLAMAARRRNLRGAFAADGSLAGRRVLVVDDVMTTGATLDALAACLKARGALEVRNLVMARTSASR